MASKRCPGCRVDLPLDSFGALRSRPDGVADYCKACTRERRIARTRAARRTAVEIYGGRCVECDSVDELQFDHPNGDGGKHRAIEGAQAMYFRIARTGSRIKDFELQLLCRPCHMKKNGEESRARPNAWRAEGFAAAIRLLAFAGLLREAA